MNRTAWESLPPDLQSIIGIACQAITTDMTAEYTHGNALSLHLLMEDPNVEIRRFPKDVMQHLKSITDEVIADLVASDPAAAKIHASYSEFLRKSVDNQRITEQAFLETRQ